MNPGNNTRAPYGNAYRPPRAVCKICECSIFIGDDDTIWVISPVPGLAHKICAEEVPQRPS